MNHKANCPSHYHEVRELHGHRSTRGGHLPAGQQSALALEAQGGDTQARDILLETNFGLLHRIVRLSAALRHGCDYEDLMQEASLGFLRGIELYRPDGGAALSTYASRHAAGYVQRYMIRAGREIRLPVDVLRLQQRAHLERERVGHGAPDETIAAGIGIGVDRLRDVEAWHYSGTMSAEHVIVEDNDGDADLLLCDILDDPRQLAELDAVVHAKQVDDMAHLAHLDERERHIIRRICVDDMKQCEIAREMGNGGHSQRKEGGVSRQRVEQLKSRAVAKLLRASRACPISC